MQTKTSKGRALAAALIAAVCLLVAAPGAALAQQGSAGGQYHLHIPSATNSGSAPGQGGNKDVGSDSGGGSGAFIALLGGAAALGAGGALIAYRRRQKDAPA